MDTRPQITPSLDDFVSVIDKPGTEARPSWSTLQDVVNTIATGGAGGLGGLDNRYAPLLVVDAATYAAGIADATAHIQALINSTTTGCVYFPKGTYKISSTLVSNGSNDLNLRGESDKSATIDSSAITSGYAIQPTAGYNITDLKLTGPSTDGSYGIGGNGSAGRTHLERLAIYHYDYGIRFYGAAQFPLKTTWRDIYIYDVASCGVYCNPSVDSGQSAWVLDNIVVTNNAATRRCTQAAGFSQTDDATATTDSLTWSGADNTEFGYTVMRLPFGSVNTDAWVWVADVASGATNYTATKTASTYWTYRVVRRTYGVYMFGAKAASVGVMQCEYFATGLYLTGSKAVEIDAFYSERRGNSLTAPTPQGDGILLKNCSGVSVAAVWAEKNLSAIQVQYCSGGSIRSIVASNCERSAIHQSSSSSGQNLEVGATAIAGTTPARLTDDASAFSHNVAGLNLTTTDLATINQYSVDHPVLSELETRFRGARRAALGGDSVGGYAVIGSSTLPTASASYDGQIRRQTTTGLYFLCCDLGNGYVWHQLVLRETVSNGTPTVFTIGRTDGSQICSVGGDGNGSINVTPSASNRALKILTGGFAINSGSSGTNMWSGSGAPAIAGTAGDFYFRTGTPTTANQRIYVCTATGAAGVATWVGIA